LGSAFLNYTRSGCPWNPSYFGSLGGLSLDEALGGVAYARGVGESNANEVVVNQVQQVGTKLVQMTVSQLHSSARMEFIAFAESPKQADRVLFASP